MKMTARGIEQSPLPDPFAEMLHLGSSEPN